MGHNSRSQHPSRAFYLFSFFTAAAALASVEPSPLTRGSCIFPYLRFPRSPIIYSVLLQQCRSRRSLFFILHCHSSAAPIRAFYLPSLLPQQHSLQWSPVLFPEAAAASPSFATSGALRFISHCSCTTCSPSSLTLSLTFTPREPYSYSVLLQWCCSYRRLSRLLMAAVVPRSTSSFLTATAVLTYPSQTSKGPSTSRKPLLGSCCSSCCPMAIAFFGGRP